MFGEFWFGEPGVIIFFCVWLQGHVWSIGDRVFESTLGEGDRVSLGETTLEEETGGV